MTSQPPVTVTQKEEILKARRAPIRRRLKKRRITHDDIAAAAGCDRTLVVHYFAGRRPAPGVERVIREMLAKSRAPRNGAVQVAS